MSPGGGPPSLEPRERIDRMRARSWALQVLYAWDSQGSDAALPDVLEEVLLTRRVSPRRIPYLTRLIAALDAHLGEVDAALRASVENWRLDRLSRVDRSVLRLGAAELLFFDEVPPKVAIQEAIRLAGQYGGAESHRFVNGVLDALYRGRGKRD